jgi:hypothetical protein
MEDLVFPSGPNIRPITFKNHIKGTLLTPRAMEKEYPWLTHCKYKVLKETFVPNGNKRPVGSYTLCGYKFPKNFVEEGTLTLVIEILRE